MMNIILGAGLWSNLGILIIKTKQSGASSVVIQEASNVKRGARAKTINKAKARAKITTKNKLQQSINCPPDSKCVIEQ
jgi:hypothetical protein